EGDFDWSNIGASTACLPTSCEIRNHWLSTVRGRFGYSFDRFMPYVTGGLAFGEVERTVVGFTSVTDTKVGWTIRAGVEGSISGPLTETVEYVYTVLGNSANSDFRSTVGCVGLKYRF